MNRIYIFLSVLLAFATFANPGIAKVGKFNLKAAALAKLMNPGRMQAKVGEGDLEKASERLVAIILHLEKSYRGNGPPPSDLIRTAFAEFLPGANSRRETESSLAFIGAWEEARGLGLFDEKLRFWTEITKGADTGKDCVFEYIVPAESVPRLSADPINVRIVAPSERRTDSELTLRERSSLGRLTMLAEQESATEVAAAQQRAKERRAVSDRKKKEAAAAAAIWKRALAEAGDQFEETPSIILKGDKSGAPSHFNGNRWRVSMRATNNSGHATEVDLEVYLIGITMHGENPFMLSKHEEKLQLRNSEIFEKNFFSAAERSYREKVAKIDGLSLKNKKHRNLIKANYRGWVARVVHGGEVIAKTASTHTFLPYADEKYGELKGLP